MKIFPAIDIKDKKCVRLIKGDFNNKTEYEMSPVDQAGKYKNYGFKETLVVLIIGGLMIATTDQLANLFKNGFQRLRPWANQDLEGLMRMIVKKRGVYSFFSGHAINSMVIAVYLGLILRKKYYYLPFILLLWAFLVGYSRIYVGVHYPSDVLTGFLFGSIIGWGFYKLQLTVQKRY